MSAGRFVWRWSFRVLRLEWRQHLMIFVLILSSVTLSVGGALAAYNLVEPPESRFGNGQFAASTERPGELERILRDQGHPFGIIESASVLRSGTTERVVVRAMDPGNEVTDPLIVLLDGRWPSGADEIAITDRAFLDRPTLGSTVELGGAPRTVVGIVENPTALSDEFGLVSNIDDVVPSHSEVATEFLIDADQTAVDFSSLSDLSVESMDGPPARTALTMIVTVVGFLGMLEIALLVGSAFAVIAGRRRRQFGLLAAAGATPKHVRRAATATGTILGTIAAALGVVIAVASTSLILPTMEVAVGHRIDYAVPLWGVLPNMIGAVFIASIAARWPSRALSELPVISLLASGRPRSEPAGRVAAVGAVLAAIGAIALVAGFARLNIALALLGSFLTPVGLLLTAPLLVRMVGHAASGMPLSGRLAARAVARHNRRSASVVAALALALAVPVGLAVVTTSIDRRAVSEGPNLAENWMIAWAPGANDHVPRLPSRLDPGDMSAGVEALRAAAPNLETVPVAMAVPKNSPVEAWDFPSIGEVPSVAPVLAGREMDDECTFCNSDAYAFGERDEKGNEITYVAEPSWVASPQLLAALGLDSSWLDSAATALVKDDAFVPMSIGGLLTSPSQTMVSPNWPQNTTVPSVLLSPDLVDTAAYDIVTVGWLGVSDGPLSDDVKENIRRATDGLRAEFHEPPRPRSGLRAAALLAGIAIGLGINISAVGLLAAELSADIRILASIGASPRTGRLLSAAMAAILAGVGGVLAALIGYVPLLPMVTSRADNFAFVVPWTTLTGLLVLFPLIAAFVGWMAAGAASRGPALRESL